MNNPEFRAAVARSGKTNKEIASDIGISHHAFMNKSSGKSEFKESEIRGLAMSLNLSIKDVDLIFFGLDVN